MKILEIDCWIKTWFTWPLLCIVDCAWSCLSQGVLHVYKHINQILLPKLIPKSSFIRQFYRASELPISDRNFRPVSEIPFLFRQAALGRNLVLHRNFRLCIGTSDECRKSRVISDKILSAENKSSVGTSGRVSELPIPIRSPILPPSKYSRENLFGLIRSFDRRSELPINT